MLEAGVLTAVFTAMAVVLSTTAGMRLPLLGANGLKISFGGIFTFLPAIMFGPVYGGISSALCDVLGCIIKPDGAYVPWFTVVAFIGGFLKGLVWKLLTKKSGHRASAVSKIAFVCLFAVIFTFGCIFTSSLNKDGLTSGLISSAEELPLEDSMQKKELSFFSDIAASLAQYNHDTMTVKKITPDENGIFTVPRKVVSGDISLSVKNIDAAVLNTEGLDVIYIPTLCSGINVPENFKLTNTHLTVVFEKPAQGKELPEALTEFVKKYSVANHIYDGEFPKENINVPALSTSYETDNVTLKSSDAYRKNLSAYINFMTAGFILTGVLGIAFILVGMLIAFVMRKKGGERLKLYMKVLAAILISGVIVTTLNTYLLLVLYYGGRIFWVIYLPRLAEELLMSVIQSYIITLILGVISSHSLFKRYLGIKSKETANNTADSKAEEA